VEYKTILSTFFIGNLQHQNPMQGIAMTGMINKKVGIIVPDMQMPCIEDAEYCNPPAIQCILR
jgi:hypothetical protein